MPFPGREMKTIKFYTLGCKVNQYETQRMRESFLGQGLREINNGRKADIYLINTCTVTQRADSESLNFLRRAKRENPRAKIIVTGCLAKLDADKIRKVNRTCQIHTHRPVHPQTSKGISYFKGHTRAFLKIEDGCDNCCSYCKVRLVRDKARSRPLNDIIREAERLVKNGYKEIVLCGICLGSYSHSAANLVEVICALEKIEGLLRIRLSSIEPQDVSGELIEKLQGPTKLCRHLHIPLQSGDDAILRRMNRRYRSADYLELVRRLKKRIPSIAITTDVMLGFPGECESSFNHTIELIQKITPLKVHIFAYSRREGTAAAAWGEEPPAELRKKMLRRLKETAELCSLEYRRYFLGKRMKALIEGRSKDNPSFWEGYTDNYLKVLLKSKSQLKNRLVSLLLDKLTDKHILGRIKCP